MKAWNFIKENPIVVLLVDGVVVCLLIIGLCVSDMLGYVSAKELLGSGLFLTCVFIAFVAPYLVVMMLGGKE